MNPVTKFFIDQLKKDRHGIEEAMLNISTDTEHGFYKEYYKNVGLAMAIALVVSSAKNISTMLKK